jgi:hypothetical protein
LWCCALEAFWVCRPTDLKRAAVRGGTLNGFLRQAGKTGRLVEKNRKQIWTKTVGGFEGNFQRHLPVLVKNVVAHVLALGLIIGSPLD